MRRTAAALLIAVAGAVALADDTKKADDKKTDDKKPAPQVVRKEPSRADRLKMAKDGYQSYCAMWVDALRRADTPEEKESYLKRLPDPAPYAGQAARLVLDDPKDDVAFDALQWLVRYRDVPGVKKVLSAVPAAKRGDPPAQLDVFAALVEHHLDNPKLTMLARTQSEHTPDGAAFLGAVVEKATKADLRGYAGKALAEMLARKVDDPDLPAAARDKFLKDAEAVYTKLIDDKDAAAVVVARTTTGKTRTLGDNLPNDLRALRELSVGKPLPDLAGRDLDGKTVSAADYKGKVLVLDVWATWCGPCVAMIPHEREMVGRLKDKPFALVSVSCDAEKKTLTDFLDKTPMPWAHWWDGQNGAVNKVLNIRFFPTIYVLDAKGVIRYKNIRGEKLEAAVNKLLKEQGDEKAAGGR